MSQKIISLSLGSVPKGMPQHFIVGMPPLFEFNDDGTMAGNEVPDSPAVSKIVLPIIEPPIRVYPGRCYVVHFTGSEVRRAIPADKNVIDVGYSQSNKSSSEAPPELPEG